MIDPDRQSQGLSINAQNGKAAFAYNADRGDPYHHLGVPVNGYGTIDEMLHAASADYVVEQFPLLVAGPNGVTTPVDTHVANTRLGSYYDGATGEIIIRRECLGIVGTNYVVEQNRDAAEFALECVGAAGSDAVIDTMGVMRGGAEFFVYIRLEPLLLDPNGVADELEMGLAVRTSHNGDVSLCAYPTSVRLVCRNSVSMSMQQARAGGRLVRIRHTANKDGRKKQAVYTLGLAAAVRENFVNVANTLLAAPASYATVERCANEVWGFDPRTATKRGATIHEVRLGILKALWESPTNSGAYGENCWSAWQTIGEYLDHCRGLDADRRAVASMDPDSSVSKRKDKALRYLLHGLPR